MMFSGELCRIFGVTVSRREALLETEEKTGRFQTLSNMEPLHEGVSVISVHSNCQFFCQFGFYQPSDVGKKDKQL